MALASLVAFQKQSQKRFFRERDLSKFLYVARRHSLKNIFMNLIFF